MDPERVLAEEFTGTHPDEAARVLETLPAEEALEALAEFSVPLASRLLGRMAMPLSAEILARIEVERAALLLEALKAHDVAALLRPMDPDKRDGVLAALAADVAGRVRRLLRHAEGSAGALMDPSALTVPEDLSVPQARSRESSIFTS